MKKVILIMSSLIILSCSSSHQIFIHSDNSATINFSVTNKDSLVDTLVEWGAIENSGTSTLIDTQELTKGLEADKNITNVVIATPAENNYQGSFDVTDIDKLFTDSTVDIPLDQQVFSIVENDGIKTLKIQLSINNYIYLKKSLPILQQESIDMLGPDANQDISQEEYLDMMSFSLGDEGPKDILNSYINLKIIVDGSITDIEGGNINNLNSASFKVPLIDLILLKKTLIYSLSYK